MNDPIYHRAPAYVPEKLMGSNVAVKPISDEICAACGKPIDMQPGETFTASTDGKVWHYGCSPSRTRPTLVTDEVVERVARVLTRELGIDPDFTAPAAPEMKMWQLRTDLARAAIAAMPAIPPQSLDDDI